MLLDWITARLPLRLFTEEQQAGLRNLTDRIQRYCPQTGEVKFESQAWDSIRSDSHQVVFRVGSTDFWLQGSPARAIGDGDAVFSSGPAAALDVPGCVDRMINVLFAGIGPHLKPAVTRNAWIVTRVDVTGNLLLGSLSEVRDALRLLRNVEGGRYKVSNQAGDTVYWSAKSRLQAGKAYAKGPHLSYLMKKKDYDGRRYSDAELDQASRLLRLELRLGREFFLRAEPWYTFTKSYLVNLWENYFGRMLGGCEVKTDNELLENCISAAPTPGQGRSAYALWCLIKSEGWERAQNMTNKRTWYHHLKILRASGLGDADFSAGNVVHLRRKIIEVTLATSWADLKRVA